MNYRLPRSCDNSPEGRSLLLSIITLFMIPCLAACTTQPTVKHIAAGPAAFADESVTFAMAPVQNDVNRQTADLVESRLKARGYSASNAPDFLVEVSTMRHSAATGGFIPSASAGGTYTWVSKPETTYRKTRKYTMTLRVRFLNPETGEPVVTSTARLTTARATEADSSGKLVDAMFAVDPLKAAGSQTSP